MKHKKRKYHIALPQDVRIFPTRSLCRPYKGFTKDEVYWLSLGYALSSPDIMCKSCMKYVKEVDGDKWYITWALYNEM